MKTTPGNAVLPTEMVSPEVVAQKIRKAETDLYERILDQLAVQPGARFTDLKLLIGKRNVNVLTKALRRLQLEGLVERRGFEEEKAGYTLTGFGVAVRDDIVFHRKFDQVHEFVSAPA